MQDTGMTELRGPPNMEKAGSVDQKAAARLEWVRARGLAQPGRFAARGSVSEGLPARPGPPGQGPGRTTSGLPGRGASRVNI